ncbi:MAG: DUF881 domain-containing protein [Candidatus Gracilibacteria bacterium]
MEKEGYSWKVLVAFVVTGTLAGLLVTAQFRSALPASSYPYDEYKVQQELIKSYSDDQGVLKTKILNLRKQIEDKQKESGLTVQKNNLEILSELKKEIGLESARGNGVVLTLNDGPFAQRNDSEGSEQFLIHAADLRDIVNLVFSAQAEALAINDQRVIASTPISSVGNTILVNNFHVLPPFTVTVIGDPDLILQRLNDTTALPDLHKRVKGQKVQFSFEAKNNLVTPVYNGDFRLKYLQSTHP